MPIVRLIIFMFRGVGRMFQAMGRFLRALVGAGVRGFLLKSFEAVLRFSFLGALIAVVAVCANLFRDQPYVTDHYESVGLVQSYSPQRQPSGSDFQRVTLRRLLNDFVPKDPLSTYGPGKLDVEGIIKVWKTEEMVHVSDQKVTWRLERYGVEVAKPALTEEDFTPRAWGQFEAFFQHAWAILTLPVLVGFLVFPSISLLRDRLYRMCVFAPLSAMISLSFAYLLARYWLSAQYEVAAQLIVDLPKWSHPPGILGASVLAGAAISLMPVALWYLLRWVLGPFLSTPAQSPSP